MPTPAQIVARRDADYTKRLGALERAAQLGRSTVETADGSTVAVPDAIATVVDVEAAIPGLEAQLAATATAVEAATEAADAALEAGLAAGEAGLAAAEEAQQAAVDADFKAVAAQAAAATATGQAASAVGQAAAAAGEAAAAAAAAASADGKASTAQSTATGAKTAADAAKTAADKAATDAATAKSAADSADARALAAAGVADSKGRVIYATSAPTATADRATANLWVDITSGKNTPNRWNGTAWVAVTDKTATDAASAAAAAQSTATSASTAAGTAQTAADAAKTAAAAAQTKADQAATAASTAQTTANGKNTVTYSTAAPTASTPGKTSGDLWFVRAANTGIITGTYEWAGTAWAQRTYGDAVIANLDAGKITAGFIAAARIAADTITTGMILAGAVTTDKITANAVTAAKIAAGTITASEIAGGTITGEKIAAGTIVAGNIGASQVNAEKLAADAVTAVSIKAGSVTAGKLAAQSVAAENIVAATITGDRLAVDAITAREIQAGSVTAASLSADAVDGKTITGATIRTAATGQRAELLGNRMDIYSPSNKNVGRIVGLDANGGVVAVGPPGSEVSMGNYSVGDGTFVRLYSPTALFSELSAGRVRAQQFVNNAGDTLNFGAVSSDAERDARFPSPKWGDSIYRSDLNWTEQYGASSLGSGSSTIGWWPINGRMPYMRAGNQTNQTVPNNQTVVANFASSSELGGFTKRAVSGGGHEWSLPFPGWYGIKVAVDWQGSAGGQREIGIWINGVNSGRIAVPVSTVAASLSLPVAIDVIAAPGDTVQFRAIQNQSSGGSLILAVKAASIMYLGPA